MDYLKTGKAALLIAILLTLASAPVVYAQPGSFIHNDEGNDPTVPDWLEETPHTDQHTFDRCTNYNNAGQTFSRRCSNEHTSSPRFNETGCDVHRDGLIHCFADTTVYCPNLGPAEAGGWLTFRGEKTAHVNEQLPPVAAGQLGTVGGAPMRGIQVGNKSCGCIPPNGISGSQFFGNPVHYGGGEYGCP